MLISVAVDERSPRGAVSEHLEGSKYLLIVETESKEVVRVLNCKGQDADMKCAQAAIDAGCEAIICGDIGRRAYDLLADNMISRYYGWGADASQAVSLMQDNRLQLIREARDGGHCHGKEHWAELQRCIETLDKKQ
ncbi:MAG: NifB/NifX family molybdenum-iron cluster-binding protein [Synergistaceae bacterium]|nr:NifB/NifX family molybdenum-iron cluster-binding protein [Synergistaceae bacterium]